MTQETNSVSSEGILSFVKIGNMVKVAKYKKTPVGSAFCKHLTNLGLNKDDTSEVVLTAKNSVLALVLESAIINKELLEQNTHKATEEAQAELNELEA